MPRSLRYLTIKQVENITKDRKMGLSYPELTKKYSISHRTAYEIGSLVQVLPDYKDAWLSKRGGSKKIAEDKYRAEITSSKGVFIDKKLSSREKLILITSLYWAEGAKKDLSFSNSSPSMIKIFVSLMKDVFKVTDSEFKVHIRIFEDLNKDECISFWSDITGLPISSVNILRGVKVGKLRFGMCRVRIAKGSSILRKIKANTEVISSLLP